MKFLFLITFFMMAAFVFASPPHGHHDSHPKSGHGAQVGHGGGHGGQHGGHGEHGGHGQGGHGWQAGDHHGHH